MNFEQALEIVLKHEGGYIWHKDDPGGETNFGITVKVAREHGYMGDMKAIPMTTVAEIYRKSYWDATRCNELQPELRLAVFDAAVNSGARRSIQWLQAAVGATADGVFGPRTLAAVAGTDPRKAARDMCYERLGFLASLNHFGTFGRGWVRRVLDILRRV